MSAEKTKPSPPAADMTDPGESLVEAPIWLIGLFAVAVYWGMLYVNDHAGEFSDQVYPPYHTLAAVNEDIPQVAVL